MRQKIGFSFQFAAMFDSMTVGDNVALPLRERTSLTEDGSAKSSSIRSTASASRTRITQCRASCSGGMLKRAGFARAVVTNPDLVLYDEPTTGLDPIVTHLLTDTIVRLRQKLNSTAVVISHDLQSIFMMADYVAMLFEGAIIEYATVDAIRQSVNPIVQQFLEGSEVGPIPL